MIKKIVFALLAMTLLLLFPAPLFAQVTYSVAPSKLEISAARGDTVAKTVQVINKEPTPLKIRVYAMDYRINPDNTFVFSKPGNETYSAATWIELQKTEFTVPAKSAQAIPFTLKIPANAEVGGHYAVIFFESAQKVKKEGLLRGRIGSLIMVTVKGGVARQGIIAGFKVVRPVFGRNVGTEVVFANDGNVHLTTRGKIDFFNSSGRKVDSEDLGEITVLPKTKRIMKVDWKDAPLFGRFKAVANVYYGSDLKTFDVKKRATRSFLIFPWVYFSVLVAAFLLLYLLKILRKRSRSVSEASGQ
ncbi:MAG: hypothetical protein Q8L35_01885 [Actinomycetota bacterium]|nr:hypothetical protein [Actinomycetota bacterium]